MNMGRLVIGMAGKAGAGKDTVADYLCRNYNFVKFSLADPLKASIKSMFMLDDETVYDRIKREEPLTDFPDWSVRKLLQFVGTDLMRKQFDDALWAKILNKRIRQTNQHSRVVIADVRFPNEQSYLRLLENDGDSVFFIKLERDGCVGHDIGLKNHDSEKYNLDGDCIIYNNGNIEDLYKKTNEMITKIIAGCSKIELNKYFGER